ncbi:hypothetical protein AM493_00990 [Flavobacterium akiainvivens]|uniref:Uncharacterized protein n=1 Tax=Flavobacterium akiainvivens TaxID=1202724 RepID=A0A0M8MFX8_9FLAO|nr:hypothetical protein [Flavobacterium akiainvivens]KOS04778.1 hypothetical protein AM493_00990 [Flavobacterium akiainvivens]SFQ66376.1 hypothetical protein SAMN05444144_11323 [Flavobacterium akiainvivens]
MSTLRPSNRNPKTNSQPTKGDRLHWQPLQEARQTSVSVKDGANKGKLVDASELSHRTKNSQSNTLVP